MGFFNNTKLKTINKMNKTFKNFSLKEKAKRNCVFIHVNFAGGDADTEHPEEYILPGITMENIDDHFVRVSKEIEDFRILKKILDNADDDSNYDMIKAEYGVEIAKLYMDTPNDPQCDYQNKCYIDRIELHAYDDNGDLYIQHVG